MSKIRFREKIKKLSKKKEMGSKNCSIRNSLHKKLPFNLNFDPTRGFLDWMKI